MKHNTDPWQDMFLEHGIALVLNVSLAALERLAMCIGAEVRGGGDIV